MRVEGNGNFTSKEKKVLTIQVGVGIRNYITIHRRNISLGGAAAFQKHLSSELNNPLSASAGGGKKIKKQISKAGGEKERARGGWVRCLGEGLHPSRVSENSSRVLKAEIGLF